MLNVEFIQKSHCHFLDPTSNKDFMSTFQQLMHRITKEMNMSRMVYIDKYFQIYVLALSIGPIATFLNSPVM